MKIAIASGKGGTGKTTLATNLAAFLSETQKIVLADLDVEEPNAGLFLKGRLVREEIGHKAIPEWNGENCILCDLCREVCRFNAIIRLGEKIRVIPELCHSCHACSELCPTSSLPMLPRRMGALREYAIHEKLSLVEARLDIGQEQAVPLIKQAHAFVDSRVDDTVLTLFDAPPGASCPVVEATRNADRVILVTEPTPFGLHDLRVIVETMKSLKVPISVVINRHGLGNDDVTDYCHREGVEILAKIPADRRIAELYSAGELVYRAVPEFREALEKIRAHIFSEKEAAGAA